MDLDPSPHQCGIIMVVAFLLSSFFSVVKIVFTSFDKNALSADQENLRHYAGKIDAIEENRLIFSTIVSMGRTSSNVAFALAALLLGKQLTAFTNPWELPALVFALSVLVLTIGAYAFARALARRYAISFVPVIYRLYAIISWILMPAASVAAFIHSSVLKLLGHDARFSFLSADEKMRMSENGDQLEQLDEEEKEMIHSIFELGETTVEEIMLPRIDIHAIEVGTTLDKILELVRQEGHSRLPVYRETIDSIVGVLYVKDVLGWLARHQRSEFNLVALMKKPHFVPSRKKIDDLMREFKAKRLHLAIVVDEYGGTAGMVTMEDILEEIVGDIQDEYDNEATLIVKTAEGIYEADPQIDLYDLATELDITLNVEDVDYNTLGGLIYNEHGDIPKPDTVIEYGGLRIRVLEMDGQRIQKVQITVLSRSNPIDNAF